MKNVDQLPPVHVKDKFFTAVQFVVGSGAYPKVSPLNHAKMVGTNLTACGMHAESWPRLWEYLFPTAPGQQCHLCEAALLRAQGSHENGPT